MTAVTHGDLSVLHIGAGRYDPSDSTHSTADIWRELAKGFRSYHVIGRSTDAAAEWREGNLIITLLRSRSAREVEFFRTQFRAVPIGLTERPDVIVSQSPVLGGLAALAITRRTGAKVLLELHGNEFFAPARFGSSTWLLQQISHYALFKADAIRVLSVGMKRALLHRYGAGLAGRVYVVPPRVDLRRFKMRSQGRNSGPLQVAMVGAINPNKGQLRLIAALGQANFRIDLHLAGDGPDLAACKRLAAAPSSCLRAHCHGRLAPDEVAALLKRVDVLVMYSRSEATPRAILEGMAAGVAVVTTNAGFCSDLLENGLEGIVLGSAPDREILPLLKRLHTDRGWLCELGRAARSRAERHYDSEKLFAAYRQLIAETAQA